MKARIMVMETLCADYKSPDEKLQIYFNFSKQTQQTDC